MVTAGAASRGQVDEREARLRVIAACCATVILGWAVYSGAHLPSAVVSHNRGELMLFGAGVLWSLLMGALPIARAAGRYRARSLTWIQSAAYVFYLPFLFFLASLRVPGPTVPAGPLSHPFQWTAMSILGAASVVVLLTLAVVGRQFDRPAAG